VPHGSQQRAEDALLLRRAHNAQLGVWLGGRGGGHRAPCVWPAASAQERAEARRGAATPHAPLEEQDAGQPQRCGGVDDD